MCFLDLINLLATIMRLIIQYPGLTIKGEGPFLLNGGISKLITHTHTLTHLDKIHLENSPLNISLSHMTGKTLTSHTTHDIILSIHDIILSIHDIREPKTPLT